ncbi:MAG TPA: shikimate dehydrogenase, partial [Sphingomicrobium sp.]|nr:shikimate dehydrogenase [Sphingomicrobium sp.]
MIAYAEVIGDPIAQSKSPVIHKYWLQRLGIQGEFVRTRV